MIIIFVIIINFDSFKSEKSFQILNIYDFPDGKLKLHK